MFTFTFWDEGGHLASLHAVRLVPVPTLRRCYQGTTTPVAHPTSLRFLRSVIPRLRLVVRSVRPETQGRRPGFFLCRQPATPIIPWRRQVLPSSWRTPIAPAPCSWTPVGRHAPNHSGALARPPHDTTSGGSHVEPGLDRWLKDGLSTLRRVSHLIPAQDSLPGVGQTLLYGLSTRRVPTKGFWYASYIPSSFPKLCLAQCVLFVVVCCWCLLLFVGSANVLFVGSANDGILAPAPDG
jgi:hypothetical protein